MARLSAATFDNVEVSVSFCTTVSNPPSMAPKLATEVIHQCLLTIGHVAYSSEAPVGQRLRDVIGLEIGDGTAQVSKLVISRHLLGREFAP